MSEGNFPGVAPQRNESVPETPDVVENVEVKAETVEAVAQEPESEKAETVNYSEKSLAELSEIFEALLSDPERQKKSKEAEAIKAAFYKVLIREKAQEGIADEVKEPSSETESEAEASNEVAAAEEAVSNNPFEAIEKGFKSLYNKYKAERAEYNKQIEKEKEDNLAQKQAVINDLKALVDKQEGVGSSFPEFRAIQARWREIGPVPVQEFRNLNDTYQFYVELFYDKVQIDRDMRDLDFKKNLEAKEKFCEEAERLSESDNVVESFRELQKLHEQWKEFGPVAKEFREQIWDRFKAATAQINKKYQAYFEGLKEKQTENLEAKTKLCERIEAIASKEDINSSSEWNNLSKEIIDIQKEWRTIGFASKKENQKIYDRFRAACDKFFERKRDFYTGFKDNMNDNMSRKLSLIEQAEALKSSTEWKETTDKLIDLQKQWKEIGAVPRKKSEILWKRFRAACDEFFAERDKNAKPENNFYGNLKAKKALIEEIKAYQLQNDAAIDNSAMQAFAARWQEIGFVPFKEKEAVAKAYKEAMQATFPEYSERKPRRSSGDRDSRGQSSQRKALSEKDRLVQRYNKLQQDIDTYENNIGFFAASKNSEPLIRQMQERIDAAKKDLKDLELQIRNIENSEE